MWRCDGSKPSLFCTRISTNIGSKNSTQKTFGWIKQTEVFNATLRMSPAQGALPLGRRNVGP